MASLSWSDFINGDTLTSIRTAINSFNNSVVLGNTVLENRIVTVEDKIPTIEQVNIDQQIEIDEEKAKSIDFRIDIDANTLSTGTNLTDITNTNIRIDNVASGDENVTALTFNEQAAGSPTPLDGQLVYKDEVLHFYGAHSEAPLKIGRMLQTEAWNTSGATILKGTPVKYAGLYGGEGAFTNAQADTFRNAGVMGVTAYDVPNLTKGIIITQGLLKDLDTSAFTVGYPTYLSQTVAGGLTHVSPDISSRVGMVLVVDGLIGQMYISIDNTIALPTTISSLLGQANSYSMLSNIPKPIIGYNRSLEVVLDSDIALGTILVQQAGIYDLVYEFSGTLSDEEINMTVELYDVTHDTILESFIFTSGRASNATLVPMSHTFRRPFDIIGPNTTLQIRMISSTNETLILNDASFTVTSIHTR